MSSIECSHELLTLVFMAVDHSRGDIFDGMSLTPFLMSETAEKHKIQRFRSDELSKSAKLAIDFVKQLPAETLRYAVTYEAIVTVDGQKYDAVMVEAGERGSEYGHTFAQRYQPVTKEDNFELIGNLTYLGKSPLLFN